MYKNTLARKYHCCVCHFYLLDFYKGFWYIFLSRSIPQQTEKMTCRSVSSIFLSNPHSDISQYLLDTYFLSFFSLFVLQYFIQKNKSNNILTTTKIEPTQWTQLWPHPFMYLLIFSYKFGYSFLFLTYSYLNHLYVLMEVFNNVYNYF